MKYCKVKDQRAGIYLYINPASVRAVKKSEFSAGASVVFNDGSAISVDGDIEDIVKALEDAQSA